MKVVQSCHWLLREKCQLSLVRPAPTSWRCRRSTCGTTPAGWLNNFVARVAILLCDRGCETRPDFRTPRGDSHLLLEQKRGPPPQVSPYLIRFALPEEHVPAPMQPNFKATSRSRSLQFAFLFGCLPIPVQG